MSERCTDCGLGYQRCDCDNAPTAGDLVACAAVWLATLALVALGLLASGGA